VLDIEVREPAAKHAITMMQVERWLEGASTSPNEGGQKSEAEGPARLALTLKLSRHLIGRARKQLGHPVCQSPLRPDDDGGEGLPVPRVSVDELAHCQASSIVH
jgi:hypothetical protein